MFLSRNPWSDETKWGLTDAATAVLCAVCYGISQGKPVLHAALEALHPNEYQELMPTYITPPKTGRDDEPAKIEPLGAAIVTWASDPDPERRRAARREWRQLWRAKAPHLEGLSREELLGRLGELNMQGAQIERELDETMRELGPMLATAARDLDAML